jgi:alpha-beta hydrolase superfamily lysophospholipase
MRLNKLLAWAAVTSLNLSLLFTTSLAAIAAPAYQNQSDIGRKLGIPVHQWVDSSQPVKAIIVAQQGLIFSGKKYNSFANYFCPKGYMVYANDMRGFGDWRENVHSFVGDTNMHFGQSKEDLTNLLKELRREYPDKPIICVGESFGANMAIWEAATDPSLLDGVIAASAGWRTCVHPRAEWVRTFFTGLQNPNRPVNLRPYVADYLSEDRKLAHSLLNDTETVNRMSVTNLIKVVVTNKRSIKDLNKIPEDMPVLLISGKDDQIQKVSALAALVPKMGTKAAKLVLIPQKGHMLLECDTVDPKVYGAVEDWLEAQHQKYVARNTNSEPAFKAHISDSSLVRN